MIKDVFELRRGAWHAKLMKFVLNLNYHDFSHICPYFWLTIFNIFALPFVALFKGIINGTVALAMAIERYCDRIRERENDRWNDWARSYARRVTSDPTELQKFASMNFGSKCNRYYSRFANNLQFFVNRADLDRINSARWKAQAEIQSIETRREQVKLNEMFARKIRKPYKDPRFAAKARINSLLKWIKPLSKLFFWVAAAGIVTFCGFLLYECYELLVHISHRAWVKTGNIVLCVLFVLFLAVVCIALIALISFVCGKIRNSCRAERFGRVLGKFFAVVGRVLYAPIDWIIVRPIVFAVRNIGIFCGLVVQMIRDNCPAIEWK